MKSNTTQPLKHSKPRLRTRIAQTDEERKAHFAIRKKVFVREQGLFQETDVDGHDESAIPIICTVNDSVGGTVRVYPLDHNTWIGGRLAVPQEFRSYLVGPLLVKEAMKTVKERGCTKFLAYIQLQNVRFFERLGWSLTGEELAINGVRHHVMEADLGKVR
jgi:putative N-acetyltransferase (TIGR04045 family)